MFDKSIFGFNLNMVSIPCNHFYSSFVSGGRCLFFCLVLDIFVMSETNLPLDPPPPPPRCVSTNGPVPIFQTLSKAKGLSQSAAGRQKVSLSRGRSAQCDFCG